MEKKLCSDSNGFYLAALLVVVWVTSCWSVRLQEEAVVEGNYFLHLRNISPSDMLRWYIPGDRVCILAGGIMLFIIRKKEEYHKLVGEAYVPGIMRGEAIEECKKKVVLENVLEIR